MRKSFTILIALVLTLFTVPFGGFTALAAEADYVMPDKAYGIDYTILHENGESNSIADSFFEKPGVLLEYGDEKYIQITTGSPEMIKAFSNEYGEYVLVDENNESKTLQLRVSEDLSNMDLSMHIVVHGLYDAVHRAILTFDGDSKEEINPEEYSLIISEGGNGPSVGNSEIEEPENPDENGNEEEPNNLDLPSGNYTFDASYLHSEKEETSAMANYLGNTVFVEVKNGKTEVTITVADKDAVTKLQLDNQDPVEVVEDDEFRYERFSLNNLSEITKAYVEYQAPYGDSVWEGNATFRLVLDVESKEQVDVKEKPGNGLLPTPVEDELSLDDGYYIADVTYHQADGNKGSAMANYLGKTVFLSVKGDSVELTVTVDDNESVTLLKVEGEDPVEIVKDGEKNYETFNLDNLSTIYNAYTEYQAPYGDTIFQGNAEFRIVVDKDSVEKVTEKDKPGYVKPENPKEEPKEEPKEDPKEEDEKTDEGKPEEEAEIVSLTPDKVYEVMYKILNENGVDVSVADGFFAKPAYILEKDGVKYIQFTVTDGEYVKALSNEFGKALILKENDDGSIVLQLKLHDDLSNMLLDMHIVVGAGAMPGFPGYDAKHKAILSLDLNSLREIDVADHLLAGTGDENNENGPYLKDQPKPEPEKPEFGEGKKDPKGDGITDLKDKKDDEKNPQTGVKTNLMVYVLLLIGSLVPPAIQLKRRFA